MFLKDDAFDEKDKRGVHEMTHNLINLKIILTQVYNNGCSPIQIQDVSLSLESCLELITPGKLDFF